MKNKRSLKIMILAALTAVVTLLCSSCVKKDYKYTGKVKTFAPGTHFVSVPTDNSVTMKYHQYECPEGYTINSIGIAYGGGAVTLYENTVTVECFETEDGYVIFGIPVEKEMKLVEEN